MALRAPQLFAGLLIAAAVALANLFSPWTSLGNDSGPDGTLEYKRPLQMLDTPTDWKDSVQLARVEGLTSTVHLKLSADVEGANMDHNGSVSNPCLTERPLLKRMLFEPAIRPFESAGFESFVFINGHRIGPFTFVALGLSLYSLHDHKKTEHCSWMGLDGTLIQGQLYAVWPGEHHELTYESLILRCELQVATPAGVGGSLLMNIDEDLFQVYQEPKGHTYIEPASPFQYELAFCSFPLYRDISSKALSQWLQFAYRSLGVEYFVINDGGGVNEEVIAVLQPYIEAGMMDINDIRALYRYESKHNVLTLNECIYQMRFIAKWALIIDFDEFLYVEPPETLRTLLQKHKGKPWVTFGSLWWSVELCRGSEGAKQWAVERMKFHWPDFYCVNSDLGYTKEMCINYHGHRKYIVNPRLVGTVEVHRVVEPIEGGVNLDANIARINHFQGLVRPTLAVCSELVQRGVAPEWWIEDSSLALEMKSAREQGPPRGRLFSSQ